MKLKITTYSILLFLLMISGSLFSQTLIRGTVNDAGTRKPVALAAVLSSSSTGTVTGDDGSFTLTILQPGKITIKVSCLGYQPESREIVLTGDGEINLKFELREAYFESDGITVTAMRTETAVKSVPARVNIINRNTIALTPALSADELLYMTPGLNINRSFGIFSHKSTVTMRGLSGNEQGRVLVMINGVPVNKSDGGSVNWNMINPDIIERIEVVKGPGSSLYGGNAMGGAINIITANPVEKFAGRVMLGYSTYNTPSAGLSLSGKPEGDDGRFSWSVNSFFRSSDGYITQSEADRQVNPYITESAMKELGINVKTGYDFDARNSVEVDLMLYDDYRGGGETVFQPKGNTTDHDTRQARVLYSGGTGDFNWKVSLFASEELYKKVNEYMRDDYTWYEVLSERRDVGLLSSSTWQSSSSNRLTFGFDLRRGSVDADDIYYTSTDIVTNRGTMDIAGLFIQDELSLAGDRIRIVSALRFDNAAFHDGAFVIAAPTSETAFMADLVNSNLEKVSWSALSPKLSALYMVDEKSRVYISFARGFRQPVLDELCRSGRIRGGFKLANPELGPETLDNIEVGTDFFFNDNLFATLSLYQSFGKDFMYYLNTGDSIDMGFGLRPILSRENISRVSITGAEAELNYRPLEKLIFTGSFSWNHSVIKEFNAGDNYPSDISGNYLTDVPSVSGSVRASWLESFGSASIIARYNGSSWVNDMNVYDEIVDSDKYPDYITVDLRFTGKYKAITANLSVQNVFDRLFYDSKGAVCPGRFITLETSVKF